MLLSLQFAWSFALTSFKTVADVVEAIIGAALLSGGQELAFRVTKTLRIDLPLIKEWSDLPRLEPTDRSRRLPQNVEKAVATIVGYEFKQAALLAEALVGRISHSTLQSSSLNGK